VIGSPSRTPEDDALRPCRAVPDSAARATFVTGRRARRLGDCKRPAPGPRAHAGAPGHMVVPVERRRSV